MNYYSAFMTNPFHGQMLRKTDEIAKRQSHLNYQMNRIPNRDEKSTFQSTYGYIEQIPFSAMESAPNFSWQTSYVDFEQNFVTYWSNLAMQVSSPDPSNKILWLTQTRQELQKILREFLQKEARYPDHTSPSLSLIFDGLGFVTADHLADFSIKVATKITPLMNQRGDFYCN